MGDFRMKISIAMAYRNRKEQLINTLISIQQSSVKDIEVVLVDDASEVNISDTICKSFPFVRYIRLEKKDKWYLNPCIPYNLAIARTTGDIIIIQNPECVHVGDVLRYVVNNLTDNNYLSISTYALDEPNSARVFPMMEKGLLNEFLAGFPSMPFSKRIGWYNHPKYRPTYYHFCAAITRKNMNIIRGFDERFSKGFAYDDNELVERVKRLGLRMEIPTEVAVIHQYHTKERPPFTDYHTAINRNKNLFENVVKRENIVTIHNGYL